MKYKLNVYAKLLFNMTIVSYENLKYTFNIGNMTDDMHL